jgi:hypothetical protein
MGGNKEEEIVIPPTSSSWLTVSKELKATLDQLEFTKDKKGSMLAVAIDLNVFRGWSNALKNLPQMQNVNQLNLRAMSQALDQMTSAGLSVKALDDSKVVVTAAEGRDHNISEKEEDEAADGVKMGLTLAPLFFHTPMADMVRIGEKPKGKPGMPGMPGGMPGMPGFPGMPGGMPGPMPNPGGNNQGGPPMMVPPQGGGGQLGGPPVMVPPQGGGNLGGPPVMVPPNPGGPGGPGMPGMPGFPGFPGMPGGKEPEKKGKDGHYALWSKEKVLVIEVQANLHERALPMLLAMAGKGMVALKGFADQANTQWHIFDLAQATQEYVKIKGTFPRGAMHRSPSSERLLDWRPDQRLSWMVELLPYLGPEFKDMQLDPNKSWDEDGNADVGFVVVPQLLARPKAGTMIDMFINVPGHDAPFAATHFVGMAGVGLDAADYSATDFATVKKRGIFGYDRVTKLDDIRDTPENTILLIQVPAESVGPWIAGGGSTVRGVSEDLDCVKPFVSTVYQNKPGTFAIMADGKVRFIPATISPDTFRAMCTIAGGEKIRNLDDVAPEVKPDEEDEAPAPVLKGEPPPAGPPPVQTPPVQTPPVQTPPVQTPPVRTPPFRPRPPVVPPTAPAPAAPTEAKPPVKPTVPPGAKPPFKPVVPPRGVAPKK